MRVIWLADSTSPHVKRWLTALQELGVDVQLYSLVKRRPRFLYVFDLISMLIRIRREPTSVVHAHFASSYGVISSFLAPRFPVVLSVWGSDVLVTPNINRLYRFLVKRALLKANVCIANSQYLASAASSVADLSYKTIPFGVKLDSFPFTPRESSLVSRETFVIGVSKRLHLVAGIDVLLNAFAIASRQTDVDLILLIVGDGPEEKRLKTLSKKLDIEHSVQWCGWCEPDEVSGFYKKMDLAVFPSRVEGLSVATIEAMASGVPVLAAAQGGLVDLVGKDQLRGSLFNLDEESLSQVIVDSVINYDSLLVKAKNARVFVEENFDIRRNAAQLVCTYKSLI